jgi:uncharacterized protein (DUF2147 family)
MLSPILATALAVAGTLQGLWATPVDKSRLRIESCGADLCGYVVTSTRLIADPDQRDTRNPDVRLRGRPMRNMKMMEVRPGVAGDWRGWIYDPKTGHTFHVTLRLEPDDRLKLTGCLLGPLCGSQSWDRVPGA